MFFLNFVSDLFLGYLSGICFVSDSFSDSFMIFFKDRLFFLIYIFEVALGVYFVISVLFIAPYLYLLVVEYPARSLRFDEKHNHIHSHFLIFPHLSGNWDGARNPSFSAA